MGASLSADSVIVAAREQVSCKLGDEAAILGLKSSIYYGLNPVGARIWDLLQQPRRIEHLRDTILREYDVHRERCEEDLFALLEQMLTEGLIEVQVTATS